MTKNKQKQDKKRTITVLLLAVAALCAIFLLRDGDDGAGNASTTVKDNDDRVAYLESFGWEVSHEPLEEVTIVIPKTFDDVFENYNVIQAEQGFDLSDYAGLEAVRYTYTVKNYPGGDDTVVADIIVYRNKVIAGDIQSTALNGFMHSLKMPTGSDGSSAENSAADLSAQSSSGDTDNTQSDTSEASVSENKSEK